MSINDSAQRAAERIGQHLVTNLDRLAKGEPWPFGWLEQYAAIIREEYASTPTIERFKVWGAMTNGVLPVCPRELLGVVIATHKQSGDGMVWRVNDGHESMVYSQGQYEFLVKMMLQCGAWEKICK